MTKQPLFELDRRSFLLGSASAGLLSATGMSLSGVRAQDGAENTPKRGGVLRMGIGGGSTSDSLDPRLLMDWVPVNQAFMVMSGFVEIDKNSQAVPEIFSSWEPSPDAQAWVFKLQEGVEFHNGKSLTVEDVIYSLNLHRGDTVSGARALAAEIADIEKISNDQIRIVLEQPNAELPAVLSDYHFLLVPEEWTDFTNPVGTGPFIPISITPGVRAHFKRNPNYWRDGAFVDEVEVIVINDVAARTNALMSGEVDVINQLDYKTVDLLKVRDDLNIIQSTSGQHFLFPMDCTSAAFADNNIRLAIKHSIDREQLLNVAFRGFGYIGNDHPIPKTDKFFNAELAQRKFDPDKAKFYLKQAGLNELNVQLSASDVVFSGAVDAAAIYRVAAAKAGINVTIKREAADGYWDNVWMKAPFCMSYRGGRATADQAFSVAYASNSTQNDAHWNNERFDRLLLEARGLLDEAKRAEIYGELQALVSDEGGAMTPVFGDYLDGASKRVKGTTTHPIYSLMGFRVAEKVWLEN